jgi:hypothetical protein
MDRQSTTSASRLFGRTRGAHGDLDLCGDECRSVLMTYRLGRTARMYLHAHRHCGITYARVSSITFWK